MNEVFFLVVILAVAVSFSLRTVLGGEKNNVSVATPTPVEEITPPAPAPGPRVWEKKLEVVGSRGEQEVVKKIAISVVPEGAIIFEVAETSWGWGGGDNSAIVAGYERARQGRTSWIVRFTTPGDAVPDTSTVWHQMPGRYVPYWES